MFSYAGSFVAAASSSAQTTPARSAELGSSLRAPLGSATADAAAFGRTLVPAMVKQGYKRDYACAVTAAGSIIGPTIPPSGLMVVYGSLMGVSIGGLFAAGLLPGLVICAVCMGVIAIGGKRENLPKADRGATLGEIWQTFLSSITALLMPVIILGGILGGIVTPTEAASIAVAYALFIGFFWVINDPSR